LRLLRSDCEVWWIHTNISNEHTAFTFSAEDGENRFISTLDKDKSSMFSEIQANNLTKYKESQLRRP
jgi:hypothetical protein